MNELRERSSNTINVIFRRQGLNFRCPCCNQPADKLVWRYDQFSRRLLGIWRVFCRKYGVRRACAKMDFEKMVDDTSGALKHAGEVTDALRPLMRFAEPVQVCIHCSEIDHYMLDQAKSELKREGRAWPELIHRRGFSATSNEIATCVHGPDGKFRGYKNDEAIAMYTNIVLNDRWLWRTSEARTILSALARTVSASSLGDACPRI